MQKHTIKSAKLLLLQTSLLSMLWIKCRCIHGDVKREHFLACLPAFLWLNTSQQHCWLQLTPSLPAPSLSTAACSPPWLLGEADRELTVMKHFPAKRKKKNKTKLIFSITSPYPSTTTHTFVPAEQRKQVVRAAAVDARSTSQSYLSGKSCKALSEVWGAAAVCEGAARNCFMLSVLDSSGLGWISLWQCLTHQWLEKEAKWLHA